MMSSPPRGPVPTRIILRKIEGRFSTICCATIPPSEKPRTSQLVKPRPSRNAKVCCAILSRAASIHEQSQSSVDHLTPLVLRSFLSRSDTGPHLRQLPREG